MALTTIIAGSRSYDPAEADRHVESAIERVPWEIDRVLIPRGRGAPNAAQRCAEERQIMVHEYPITKCTDQTGGVSNWARRERAKAMVSDADALIVVGGEDEAGVEELIEVARRSGRKVSVCRP